MESWLSGLRRTTGNRVWGDTSPRVQIPNSPPKSGLQICKPLFLSGFAVICTVFKNCQCNIRIFPSDIYTVNDSESFTVPGEYMIVPPAAGHASGAGRGNIICSEIHPRLEVIRFLLQCTELINDHGCSVLDEFVVQAVHKEGNFLFLIFTFRQIECAVRALCIQRKCIWCIGMH